MSPRQKRSSPGEFIGTVTTGTFGQGSKSEHQAVYLETDDGERYVLRRQGGNPFHDPELHALVGKRIRSTGVVADYTLLVSSWTVIGDATRGR